MSDDFSKILDEEYERKKVNEKKKCIIAFKRRIDMAFTDLTKEMIPDKFVEKYLALDIKWRRAAKDVRKAIHKIQIQSNVDFKTEHGIVFWLDPNILPPIEMVNDIMLGICQTMYKVVGGKPRNWEKMNMKEVKRMTKQLKGNGPVIECENVDKNIWGPGMSKDGYQHVTLAFSKETKRYKIFCRVASNNLSDQLKSIMKKHIEEGNTLKHFLKSKDYHYFLKTCLRNANRLSVDASRYFTTEIELVEDGKTLIEDNYQKTTALMGVPCSVGFSNVFVHYPEMDLKMYQRYVSHLRTSPQNVHLYRHRSKSEAVCFFKGAVPQRRYSVNMLLPHKTMNFDIKNNNWVGFVSMGHGENLYCFRVNCNENYCRYISYPDVFIKEEPALGDLVEEVEEEIESGEDISESEESDIDDGIPTADIPDAVIPDISKLIKLPNFPCVRVTQKSIVYKKHKNVVLDVEKVVYGPTEGVEMHSYVNVAQFVID